MTPADDREAMYQARIIARRKWGEVNDWDASAQGADFNEGFEVGWKAATERAREPDSNSQNKSQSNVTEAAVQVPLAKLALRDGAELVFVSGVILTTPVVYLNSIREPINLPFGEKLTVTITRFEGGIYVDVGKPVAEASRSDEQQKNSGQQAGAES